MTGYNIIVGPVGDKCLSEPETSESWVEVIKTSADIRDVKSSNWILKSYTWFFHFLSETELNDIFCKPGRHNIEAGECTHIQLTPETIRRITQVRDSLSNNLDSHYYRVELLDWILFWYKHFEGQDKLVIEIN